MSGRLRLGLSMLAAGSFVGVFLLWLVARHQLADLVPLLYAVPVALVALAWRRRGGLLAAALAEGLVAVGAAAGAAHPAPAGYLALAVAFFLVGGLSSPFWRRPAGDPDSRWFEMSNDLLVEASLDGYFTRLSARWEECLGWTREELMARPFRELVHPEDLVATNVYADALDEHPGEVVNFENRYLAKDGSWRWLLWSARSDEHRKYAVARDVTERKALEEERLELLAKLESLARTDALTGLPNRRALDEELERAIADAARHERALALAIIDLDEFKAFNDTFGHAAGDEMLVACATSWAAVLRPADLLARYGGEEFTVLLPGCPPGEAEDVLERVRAATPGGLTCSVGIASWVRDEGGGALMRRADAALYAAKRGGRDRLVAAE